MSSLTSSGTNASPESADTSASPARQTAYPMPAATRRVALNVRPKVVTKSSLSPSPVGLSSPRRSVSR